MRVVAIGASHKSRIHRMLEGHREVGADIRVAPIAEFRLYLCQQELGSRGFMYRVTLSTNNVVLSVRRVADICADEAVGMAPQAGIENLFRGQLRKGNDGCFAPVRRDVQLARAVAALAAGVCGLFLSRSNAFEMRVLVEREPDVWVAGFADHASDKGVLRISSNGRTE